MRPENSQTQFHIRPQGGATGQVTMATTAKNLIRTGEYPYTFAAPATLACHDAGFPPLHAEGPTGLYSGLSAAVMRQCSYGTMRLGFYDIIKSELACPNRATRSLAIHACLPACLIASTAARIEETGGVAGASATSLATRMMWFVPWPNIWALNACRFSVVRVPYSRLTMLVVMLQRNGGRCTGVLSGMPYRGVPRAHAGRSDRILPFIVVQQGGKEPRSRQHIHPLTSSWRCYARPPGRRSASGVSATKLQKSVAHI